MSVLVQVEQFGRQKGQEKLHSPTENTAPEMPRQLSRLLTPVTL